MMRPEEWTPVDKLVLEPNALSAVKANAENVVVIAGPGAGKTELLAQRADFLFHTGLCTYPHRILAVSFKVDAARNLRERVRHRSGARYASRFDSFTFHAFAKRIIDNYRPALTGDDALNADYRIGDTWIPGEQITFADMVPLALKILEKNPYARRGIRQTYSHVFFDEFQDVTDIQYELVKLAFSDSPARLTAVGDVKQRIMVYAGALEGIFQSFADDFGAISFPLYQNFRSAPRLRRMQNRMVCDLDPESAVAHDSLLGHEGVLEVHGFHTSREEAAYVSDLVKAQLDAGMARSELAILIRQQPHLYGAHLFEALTARHVPFRNEQKAQSLTAEPASALIINFIRVVADDKQSAAYTALMRVATQAIASEEEALRSAGRFNHFLQEVRAALSADLNRAGSINFWRFWVGKLISLLSRPVLLALSPEYTEWSRVDELIDRTLSTFEEALRISSKPAEAVQHLTDTDAIRILTIHKCKGLEFEHVVVMGVENETFWGSKEVAAAEYFVGISRARRRLTLTWAQYRERPEGYRRRWDSHRTAHGPFLNYAQDVGPIDYVL